MTKVGRELPFIGISTFCKFPFSRSLDNIDVAIIGAPLDQGTTYRSGTRFGPRAIRQASQIYGSFFHKELGIYDIDLGKYKLSKCNIIDYGDIPVAPTLSDLNMDMITSIIRHIVRKNVFPVTIGGDHSVSFPVVKAFKNKPFDIVHFDTHLDFMDNEDGIVISHANPIKRISELNNVNNITQIGIRGLLNPEFFFKEANTYGSKIITAEKALKNGMDWTLSQIPTGENIYVTIDIDSLDPSVAPGTGTPEPGGFNYLQLKELLTGIPKKGHIIGFDLVEVNPLYDHAEITSQVASRLIIDFLASIWESRT